MAFCQMDLVGRFQVRFIHWALYALCLGSTLLFRTHKIISISFKIRRKMNIICILYNESSTDYISFIPT
jgi:hypothetical protein